MSFFGALIGGMGEAAIDMSDSVIAERKEQRLLELQRKYDTWKQDRADRLARERSDLIFSREQTEADRRAAADRAEADRRHELAMQRINAGKGAPETITGDDGKIYQWDGKEWVESGIKAPLKKTEFDQHRAEIVLGDREDAQITLSDPNATPEERRKAQQKLDRANVWISQHAYGSGTDSSGNLIPGLTESSGKKSLSEIARLKGAQIREGIVSGEIPGGEAGAWDLIASVPLSGSIAEARAFINGMIVNAGLDPNNAPDELKPLLNVSQSNQEKPVSKPSDSQTQEPSTSGDLITPEPSGQGGAIESGRQARENLGNAVDAAVGTAQMVAENTNEAGRAIKSKVDETSENISDWLIGFFGTNKSKASNEDAKKLIEGLVMYEALFQKAKASNEQKKYLQIINKIREKLKEAGYSDAKIKQMKSEK